MELSSQAQNILAQINTKTLLGDLRKIAKYIKKDHKLAMELWSNERFLARRLATLIMDNKLLSQDFINKLDGEMQKHTFDERNQLMDWLMANQLSKDKKTIALMESWENTSSSLQRRTFWYHQGRLRWMGQAHPNNEELLTKIEKQIENEAPEVQWAMNFTAGWIGVYDKMYRSRCITLGEKTGLYKGKMVSKGCTPEYLPEFILIEGNKRNI
jgi:3-methyladenine DNA glycosylase AlkD